VPGEGLGGKAQWKNKKVLKCLESAIPPAKLKSGVERETYWGNTSIPQSKTEQEVISWSSASGTEEVGKELVGREAEKA